MQERLFSADVSTFDASYHIIYQPRSESDVEVKYKIDDYLIETHAKGTKMTIIEPECKLPSSPKIDHAVTCKSKWSDHIPVWHCGGATLAPQKGQKKEKEILSLSSPHITVNNRSQIQYVTGTICRSTAACARTSSKYHWRMRSIIGSSVRILALLDKIAHVWCITFTVENWKEMLWVRLNCTFKE